MPAGRPVSQPGILEHTMNRRDFLAATTCGVATLSSSLLSSAQNPASRRPNLVLVFADDLGYGDLSCFGAVGIKTPNLDRMANEGRKFTNFYSASSVCTPSRAALLTGRYPIRSGMVRVLFPNEPFGLPESELTIAELLSAAGYRTACIGKWHLGDLPEYRPNRHGFHHYFGIHYSNDMDPEFHRREMPHPLRIYRNEEVVETPVDQRFLTRKYTEEAQRFILEDRERPFLLYLPHTMPHWPWFASEGFDGKAARGPYGDTVAEVDWSVGEILKTLRESGLDENTLVVFTSDNGASAQKDAGNNGPFRGFKFSTWEGGFREPFIARWPGKIPPGTVCEEMASTMDLFATFATLGNAEIPTDRVIDGVDLSAALLGKGPSLRHQYAFFDSPWDSRTHLRAFRSGHWKVHFAESDRAKPQEFIPAELYHLGLDPSERHNVLKENPNVAARLAEEATDLLQTVDPVPRCPPLQQSQSRAGAPAAVP
jgi:arylsulfatase A-like enzyme